MKSSILQNTLWAAGFVAHVSLLLILIIRKNLKGFPCFIAQISFQAVQTAVLFFVSKHGSKHAYFLCYWIGGYIGFALPVGVIVEIARDVLHPVAWWMRERRMSLLLGGTLGLVAMAAMSLAVGPSGAKPFYLWETRVELFIALLMCGTLVAVSIVATSFHLHRGRHTVALVYGLFVLSYSVLLQDLAQVIVGWDRQIASVDHIVMVLYLAVIVYWAVTFWKPEQQQEPPPPEMIAHMIALHEQVKVDLIKFKVPPK